MALLSVTVKKASYVGMQAIQLNTYVTLKLQNVKSTTVTVKGPAPSWEQDFLFETNDLNTGLLIEVWNRGVIWDKALGYHWLPLQTVAYSDESMARWVELEAHLVMRGGEVVGTTGQTGHALLLDCKFELPFDAENGEAEAAVELQRKLDLLNGALDAERAEQARRQMQYITTSGYSEDSDYTSDLNYPVGQHPNCSASQYRATAHQMRTPQRSLEVSRENSYEDPYLHPEGKFRMRHDDSEPLYYNSRPRTIRDDWSLIHSELQAQASLDSTLSWQTATEWHSAEDQRRPSLERQDTLYDDGYCYDTCYPGVYPDDPPEFSHQSSYEEYLESTANELPYEVPFQDTRVGRRRSSVVQLPQTPGRKLPSVTQHSELDGMAPYIPKQRRVAASLPATPPPTTPRFRALPVPPTPSLRRRRLPQPPAHTHVPYTPTKRSLPVRNYSLEDTSSFYYDEDEDGMQPFFNETPHATPPAGQKAPWSEVDSTQPFNYPLDNSQMIPYQETMQYQLNEYPKTPKQTRKLPRQPTLDYSYEQDEFSQPLDEYNQNFERKPTPSLIQNESRYTRDDSEYYSQFDPVSIVDTPSRPLPDHLQHVTRQPPTNNISNFNQKLLESQPALQTTPVTTHAQQPAAATAVIAGAQTFGRFMFGGAAKLGSLFGAAAAAVQPALQPVQKQEVLGQTQFQKHDQKPVLQRLQSLPGMAPVEQQYIDLHHQTSHVNDPLDSSNIKTDFIDEVDNFRYEEPITDHYNDSEYNQQQVEGYRESPIKSPGRESIISGRKISVGGDSRRSSQQEPYSKVSPTHMAINGYGSGKNSLANGFAPPLKRHVTVEEYDEGIPDLGQESSLAEEKEDLLSFHEEKSPIVEEITDQKDDLPEEDYQEAEPQKDTEEKQEDRESFKNEPRVTMTPKQRWHHAYTKIINVSVSLFVRCRSYT